MSRYQSDEFDENFPNQAQMWWANAERHLAGRTGQAVLAELHEAEQCPPGPQQLLPRTARSKPTQGRSMFERLKAKLHALRIRALEHEIEDEKRELVRARAAVTVHQNRLYRAHDRLELLKNPGKIVYRTERPIFPLHGGHLVIFGTDLHEDCSSTRRKPSAWRSL